MDKKYIARGIGYITKRNLPALLALAATTGLGYKEWKAKKKKRSHIHEGNEIELYLEYLGEQVLPSQPPAAKDIVGIGKKIGDNINKGLEQEKGKLKPEPSIPSNKREIYENEIQESKHSNTYNKIKELLQRTQLT